MELTVGTIITGKVTTITKFGAFVALPGGKSGLVHISEVSGSFVTDVHDFLTEGQEVPVKVLSISPEGKISLSVKQAQPPKPRPQYADRPARPRPPRPNPARPNPSQPAAPPVELTFEDNLIQSRTFRAFEAFLIATALYLCLAIALRRLLNWAGPRFFFGR